MNARANLIVVGTGIKGSGKSKLLADRYVARQPRVIHLDPNDEVVERTPGAIRAMGLSQLYDYLTVAARRQARAFNIAVMGFQPGDVAELLGALVPPEGPSVSVARAFGALALECGEMGMLCQVDGRIADALSVAMMNARHHGLSLFLATQYPYSLPASARGNSDEVFFFQQDEPQAIVWARQVVGDEGASVVAQLRDHAFLLYVRSTGALYLCDKQRHVIQRFQKGGALAEPARPTRPVVARAPLTRPESP